MRIRMLSILTLVLGLSLPAVSTAATNTSIFASPCVPGTGYDPECDVDHDGDVDIADVQLTAGHFNQAGVWTSNNDHNHLGQTWGGGQPLVFSGNFRLEPNGPPAPLVLSNTNLAGSGLWIESVKETGVLVNSADVSGVEVISAGIAGVSVSNAGTVGVFVYNSGGDGFLASSTYGHGFSVYSAGGDGFNVGTAGSPTQSQFTYDKNGFEVAGAEDNGLYVGRADQNGVRVLSAGDDGVLLDFANRHGFDAISTGHDGVHIGSAASHGMYVENAGLDGVEIVQAAGDGLRVGNAGTDGIFIDSAGGYAGYFGGSVFATQYLGGQIVEFAVNSSDIPLEPSALVAPTGMESTEIANAESVIQVVPANGSTPAIGVVLGRAEPRVKNVGDEDKPQLITRLVGTNGAAGPGEYVSVLVFGKTELRASAEAGSITAGSRVAVDSSGEQVRALRMVDVDGIQVSESLPTVGIALEDLDSGNDMIWVLVNPQ